MKIREFFGQVKGIFVSKRFNTMSVNNDDYWSSRLNEDQSNLLNSFQLKRVDFICNNIEEGSNLLDVGSGPGLLIEQIRKQKNISATGIENSNSAIKGLRERNFNHIKSDITQGIFLDCKGFDHILFLEVLEHLPNSEVIILEALDKANKSVFFSVPNSGYLFHRIRMLFGRFPVQWKVFPGEHLRFWTIKDMKIWISCLGLKIEKKYFYEGIPLVNKIFPNLFAMGQIYKVTKEKELNT